LLDRYYKAEEHAPNFGGKINRKESVRNNDVHPKEIVRPW